MNILYNIIIYTYIILVNISSIFNKKANLWVKGRKGIWEDLEKETIGKKDIVWFHCASLGEFEQGKELIKSYKSKYPKHKILITFFSPSGYEICKKTKIADFVFYLPIDTKKNAIKFLEIIKPIKAIFIKYEFWFNYISELKRRDIPSYSVSVIFRKNQIFFTYKWLRKQLQNITHFFVQDEYSANILTENEIKNYTIVGDTRFDTVLYNSKQLESNNLVKEFCNDSFVIIGGSTWRKEEEILIKYINEFPEKKYIIAPHEIDNVNSLQKKTNGIMLSHANSKNINTSNVLIVDSIGTLSTLYKYANIAFIGGGFGKGIHNILEALVL